MSRVLLVGIEEVCEVKGSEVIEERVVVGV